jgi:2-phosphoglycerate kinase
MTDRDWTILLIGGTSTAGKTTLAETLARRLSTRYLDLDLFWITLQPAVPPEVAPELHLFEPDSIWSTLTPEELVERYLRVSKYMCHAIEHVIAHHSIIDVPVILDGAWVLPAFARQRIYAGHDTASVRSLFLVESSKDEIGARLRARPNGFAEEPAIAQQNGIDTQWLYGQEIKRQAEALHLPVLESRPFDTLLDRALTALETPRTT